MQVYLVPVSDGDYWEAKGIFSTPELAEEAREFYLSDRPVELALDYLPPHPVGKYLWHVHVQEDGTIRTGYRVSGDDDSPYAEGMYPNPLNSRFIKIWAWDKHEALELAQKSWKELTVSGTWRVA